MNLGRFRRLVGVLVIILAIGEFLLDLHTPHGLGVWAWYFVPLLLSLFIGGRLFPYQIAALLSLLMAAGFYFGSPEINDHLALVNRCMGAGVLWIVALLIVHHKQAETELRRANRALATIRDCNQAMVRAASEPTLLQDVCRVIVEAGGYRLAWVGLAQPDEAKTVQPAACAGTAADYVPLADITWADTERGRGPTGTAIRTGRPAVCRNLQMAPEFTPWRETAGKSGFASSIALPLMTEGRTFGALSIYAAEPDAFNAGEVELLTELANDVAYGITSWRTREKRRQAEAALRQANAYNRSLLEASLDPLLTISADGKITDVNAATETVTGCSRAALVGTDFCDYFTEPDKARAGYQRVFAEGAVWDYPLELRRRDGRVTSVLYNASVYRDEYGAVQGVFAAARDVTERKRAEAEIRKLNAELEQRVANRTRELHRRMMELQTIFETVPVGLAIADDPEGRHIRGNPTIERLTGVGAGGELSLTAGTPPAYRAHGTGGQELPPSELPMQRACRGEVVSGWLMEIARPDGQISVLHSNATPLRDENGELRGAVGAFMDITGLKRAEAALQQERDRLAALIASVRDEIWFADSAGRFTLMNPAACREFNLEPNARLEIRELATRLEVFRADGSPRPAEEAPPLRALRGETVTNLEEVIRMPGTSQMRYREVSAAPVRDNTGQIIGSVSVVRDITERKQAEAALRESEELRRAIMDNSPDAIYVKDRQSRWLMGNPEVLRIVRKTAEQVTGKTDLELYDDPTIGRAILENDRRIMQNGKSETFEEVADTPEGRRTFQSTKAPRRDTQGNIIGLIGVSRDITEQKKAELALTKQREELQLILDSCPAFIFYKDRENRFLRVNQAFANALQMQKAALDGRSLFDLFPREQAEVYWKDDQEVMASGKPKLAILEQMQTPEGRRWMQTDKVPSHDSTGNVNGIIGFAVDITDRKQAEEALRQSELRFHTIYDTAPVSIWQEDWTEVIALIENLRAEGVTDFGAWFAGHPEFVTRALAAVKILDVNQWTLDMFQARDKAELLASLGTVFATPDTRPGFIGELVALVQGQAIYRTEMALNTVGGNQIYGLLAMSFPPPGSDSGSVLVSVIDITERKTAEAALRESEERMRQALRASHSFTFEWKPAMDQVRRSASCGPILGLSGDEVCNDTGQRYFQRIHPDDRARFVQMLQELTPAANSYTTEYRVTRGDGSVAALEEVGQAAFDTSGKLDRLIGVTTDITERKRAEEALRLSEETFSTTFHSNAASMALTRLKDDRVIDANDAWLTMVGLSRDQVVGRLARDTGIWKNLSCRDELLQELKLTGFLQNRECVGVRNNGEEFVFLLSARVITLQGEQLAVGSGIDITARKQAEAKLAQISRMLAEGQKIAHLGSFEYIAATQTTVWSEEEFRIYGLDPAGPSPAYEVMLAKYIHPDDAARLHETFSEAMRTGSIYEIEHRIVRPDGTVRWVYNRAHPYFDANATLDRYVGATLDITERKQVEEALRRSEEQFKAIASHTPDHILVQNRNLRYELVINPQIGLTEQDMIGKTDHDFLKPADANKLTRIKRQVLETGQPVHVEEPLMSPAGEQRFFEGTYVPRFNARGLVDGLIGYFRDTTERKRVEEQIRQLNTELRQRAAELEAANKELEAFAYSVSHDLRAPLRAIDGFSRILLEDHAAQLNDQGRDSLRRVCDATRRMGQLIDDLLNLSRVIRSEMRRGPVDLSAAAARIAEELRQSDPARAVEFKIQPGLKAEGDANLLRLVLENLLGNAWKFTAKQPAPVIEFGAMLRDDVPAFFVRDNGAGFDMAFAGKLFGAFQRLHSTADFPGTGIGLATVQRIIRRHGGQVTAEGAVGRGATFTFTLQPQPP